MRGNVARSAAVLSDAPFSSQYISDEMKKQTLTKPGRKVQISPVFQPVSRLACFSLNVLQAPSRGGLAPACVSDSLVR